MYPDAEQIPGLVIYRFDGPLIFANANIFKAEVRHLAHADPPPAWIIIAAEPITSVDTTAADMLEELDAELEAKGIRFVFAEMKDAVRNEIRHYGMTWMADQRRLLPDDRDRGEGVPGRGRASRSRTRAATIPTR